MDVNDTFVIAVSGGVDSVVLLHKLVSVKSTNEKSKPPKYIVAHFDHGIRKDSHKDAEFVKKLAESYGLEVEIGYGKLGKDTSEADARTARYEFLRKIMTDNNAKSIVTAHHQDDVIETMVINMIRGTSARGLSPMSSPDILRPLLNKSKDDLIEYANENNLDWVEDSTNNDEKYLRNYVRINIMKKLEPVHCKLIELNKNIESLYQDIDIRIKHLLPVKNILNRSKFLQLPYVVQKELIRSWLVRSGVEDIDKELISRCVIACKTLGVGKKVDVGGTLWLVSEKQNLLLVSK